MLATRAADASCALVYVNLVGGQDELVFDGASMVFDAEGRLVAAMPQFEEAVSIFDLEVRPTYRKRLLDPRGRHRAPALPEVVVSTNPRQPVSAPRVAPPMAEPLGPEEEVYARPRPRDARLRPQKRFLRCGRRPFGWNRFVTGGRHRRRRPRAGVSTRRVDAVALYQRRIERRRRRAVVEARHRLPRALPIEPAHDAVLEMLAGTFAGTMPGLAEENIQSRLRGRRPDGPVQQVRLAGADDRQQKRVGGRLFDALRRYGGRFCRDKGRAENPRLPAVRMEKFANAK